MASPTDAIPFPEVVAKSVASSSAAFSTDTTTAGESQNFVGATVGSGLRVMTWNVNGLRRCIRRCKMASLKEWLDTLQADIVCVQVSLDQCPPPPPPHPHSIRYKYLWQ